MTDNAHIIIGGIVGFCLAGFILIACLNTLGAGIEYGLREWLAAMGVIVLLRGGSVTIAGQS